ncbi:hypothetical protein KP509_15G069300 [Ceratopteris richardii]|uniref:Uncharacterized protein n=1 Tax=Ceratopteris richardii TaxID=49495 RepID=A0A8T2T6B5_CERRI|nr:hypothetical protein KP509_15G069300 [Ceratopteris richardii]
MSAFASISVVLGLKLNHDFDYLNPLSNAYFENNLPVFKYNTKKCQTSMCVNIRGRAKPKDHTSNGDYLLNETSDMPMMRANYNAKLEPADLFEDQHGRNNVSCTPGNHTDAVIQQYENQYSKLRLGRNPLNFFSTSLRSTQEALSTSKGNDFGQLMYVGSVLLKEGEQGLDGRLDVGVADCMLKEAAVRFAAALAMDPSHVTATESWGTALLVHGKLKLLLSEKLRDMLMEARGSKKKIDSQRALPTLEEMIPNICEQCEILLVEAGRKFARAVSINKGNGSAMCNWGLALFYRARLIAADGLEDPVKRADKLYLTAIEKFKAAIQLSDDYAGAAYLGWGLAARDQYWLHRSSGKEDNKLLEQAKWASEQAVQAYPYRFEATLALQACIEELEHHDELH